MRKWFRGTIVQISLRIHIVCSGSSLHLRRINNWRVSELFLLHSEKVSTQNGKNLLPSFKSLDLLLQSTLVISKYKGFYEILRDIRTST